MTDSPAPGLRWAGSTDGLADLSRDEVLSLFADAGYDGVALTLGGPHLDASAADGERLRARCEDLGLGVVVHAGPGGPGLVAASEQDRARALDVVRRAAEVAVAAGAEALVLGSGAVPPGADRPRAWRRLREGVIALVQTSGALALAVEPAPGALVADGDSWQRLQASVPEVRLALHAGRSCAAGPYAPDQAVRVFAPHLAAVTLPDLPAPDGDLLRALAGVGHAGLVGLELSRDGADPRAVAVRALARTRPGGAAP